jgi:hypothetical protein
MKLLKSTDEKLKESTKTYKISNVALKFRWSTENLKAKSVQRGMYLTACKLYISSVHFEILDKAILGTLFQSYLKYFPSLML